MELDTKVGDVEIKLDTSRIDDNLLEAPEAFEYAGSGGQRPLRSIPAGCTKKQCKISRRGIRRHR